MERGADLGAHFPDLFNLDKQTSLAISEREKLSSFIGHFLDLLNYVVQLANEM